MLARVAFSWVLRCVSLLLIVGCGLDGGAQQVMDRSTPPATRTSSPGEAAPAGQNFAVRRGPLSQTVTLEGRVVATTEAQIAVPQAATVRRTLVSPGDAVRKGSPLLELDVPVESESAVQANDDGDVAARERLLRVVYELARFRSSSLGADRLAAESALVLARADLQRRELDLAQLTTTANSGDRRLAEQDLDAARATLQRAETDQERILRGPDAAEIRRAENDVSDAESTVTKAQGAYRQIVRGPDPAEIRAAERDIEDAERMLQLAQAVKTVPLPTPTARPSGNGNREVRAEREARARVEQDTTNQQAQRELSVRRAEAALDAARERLARAQRAPTRTEIDAAANDVEVATRRLDDARERLARVRGKPDRDVLDAAAAAVASARSAVARAERRLADLDAGPPSTSVTSLTAAVDGARAAVRAAEIRLTDLLAREAAAASQDAAASADAEAIAAALAGPLGSTLRTSTRPQGAGSADPTPVPPPTTRVRSVTSQLVAPVDGIIRDVMTSSGEKVQTGQPVVILAVGGQMATRFTVSAEMARRVAPGMPSLVRFEDDELQTPAVVDEVAQADTSEIVLKVDWGDHQPALNSAARATITLAHRPDALIVPTRAIHLEANRQYVEVIENGATRRVDVSTGLNTGAEVEILYGLQEGQLIRVS